MSSTKTFERAKQHSLRASTADAAGDLQTAYDEYVLACECLGVVIKHEKNPSALETIRGHMEKLLERAECIRPQLVNKARSSGSGSGGGGGGDSPSSSGGAGNSSSGLSPEIEAAFNVERPNVQWAQVAGLHEAKRMLRQAIEMPLVCPHLFKGPRKPIRSVLLYGPPGTGKTFLAKAVATSTQSAFMEISPSAIMNKYVGDSEKNVMHIFQAVRAKAPAVLFIDEIDALCGQRNDTESESSRRVKSEMLIQLNAILDETDLSKRVLLMGATNIPWNLDNAMTRRFDARIYIELPGLQMRAELLQLLMTDTPHCLEPADFERLAELTQGYSCSDISNLVSQAANEPLTYLHTATYYRCIDPESDCSTVFDTDSTGNSSGSDTGESENALVPQVRDLSLDLETDVYDDDAGDGSATGDPEYMGIWLSPDETESTQGKLAIQPCSKYAKGSFPLQWSDLLSNTNYIIGLPVCSMVEFSSAMERCRPSVDSDDMAHFIEWTGRYGSSGK